MRRIVIPFNDPKDPERIIRLFGQLNALNKLNLPFQKPLFQDFRFFFTILAENLAVKVHQIDFSGDRLQVVTTVPKVEGLPMKLRHLLRFTMTHLRSNDQ